MKRPSSWGRLLRALPGAPARRPQLWKSVLGPIAEERLEALQTVANHEQQRLTPDGEFVVIGGGPDGNGPVILLPILEEDEQ